MAAALGPVSIAVAGAEDREVLLGGEGCLGVRYRRSLPGRRRDAYRGGGRERERRPGCHPCGGCGLPPQEGWSAEVAGRAVGLVRQGGAGVLVKGKLDTADLLRAVLDSCLLYTSDAADDLLCVDLGGS